MNKFDTRCVHSGGIDSKEEYINTPVYQTSTFQLDSDDYEKIKEGRTRDINIYTRYGNPTVKSVEKKIALLEGGEDAIAFSSGMGAISAAVTTFLKPGDKILTTSDLYGGTYSFFREQLSEWGVESVLVDPKDTDKIIENLKDVKIVFFESLSNPLLKMFDIERVHDNMKEEQILMVDNTFLTPFNFKPLNHGADIVIHSASKYLNGHSDLIGGFVAGENEMMEKVWHTMLSLGSCMSPMSAYLLERGMKTLGVRMRQHNRNAEMVAEFLKDNEDVEKVIYPGLDNYEQVAVRDRYMKGGYGGVVTLVLRGDDERGVRFMHELELINEASSLGGVESLISMPYNTSHSRLTVEERKEMGIMPGTLRLSCGIEDGEDIIKDVERALSRIS